MELGKKINVIEKSIVLTDKDIIVQQVNCIGRMGSGLARVIMNRYPNVRKEYLEYHRKAIMQGKKDEELLGEVQYVDVHDGKIVANVFGQVDIRKGEHDSKVYTVKEALIAGIQNVKELAEKNGFSVAIPTYIGCGLANGNWEEIKPMIEKIFEDGKVKVEFYHYR